MKNVSENLAKKIADFRPLISRKSGCKKFHEKPSTFSTRDETKFFHREILGGGCPKYSNRFGENSVQSHTRTSLERLLLNKNSGWSVSTFYNHLHRALANTVVRASFSTHCSMPCENLLLCIFKKLLRALNRLHDIFAQVVPSTLPIESAKTKRGRREGDGKKMSRQSATNVTTIYDMSRQFATFYDNFRLFVPLTLNVIKRHKSS